MIIREIKEKSPEEIEQIWGLFTVVYGSSPWTKEQIEESWRLGSTSYIGAFEADGLAGVLVLQRLGEEQELLQIAVDPQLQGRGIGRALLEQLDQYAPRTFLEVRFSNERARALYRSVGFVEIARRKAYYHHPTEDAIIMQRETKENECLF